MNTQAVQTKSVDLAAFTKYFKAPQARVFRSPAWICLLCAIAARIWLVVYTRGIIEGDEALLGMQAEQILHGAHPIYFFCQPYMGTLQAHLLPPLFFIPTPP